MSAVTRLKLSHFRSHLQTELEVHSGPVAIFGPNGSGKTNILEALSLLSPGRGLRRASVDDFARAPEALGWKIAAEVVGSGGAHEVETLARPGEPRQVFIDEKQARQLQLGRVARVLWLVPSMDRIWTDTAEGRRRFLDRMTMSFDPDHGSAVLTYDKAMRERNRLLRDQVSDSHWYMALESQMAEVGARITAARLETIGRLMSAQDGAETRFPSAVLSLTGPPDGESGLSRAGLAAALSESRRNDMSAGRTLVGPHRADVEAVYSEKEMPASRCSTGEQKALLVSLVLANARALTDDLGEPPILLLDEVAAHLDESRRSALYDEICGLGAQAWLTGTGAELFEQLGERAQYFHVAAMNGRSVVEKRPTPR